MPSIFGRTICDCCEGCEACERKYIDKNANSTRHFGSGHVSNFLAKIANLRKKLLSIRTALNVESNWEELKTVVFGGKLT
jgi:hypothetical protein